MLQEIKVNRDRYYKVGYSPELKHYILAKTITWIAWYERYYSISEDKYKWFNNDIDKLNHLADELYHSGTSTPRFTFSEMSTENNYYQTILLNKVFQRSIKNKPQQNEEHYSEIIQICHINMNERFL